MTTLTFFNHKAGVGKTSLVYHLAWMFAELRTNVLVADLDPQSSLTASFLEGWQLEDLWTPGSAQPSILSLVQPLLDRIGDIREPQVLPIHQRIGLIPGELGLSLFEDRLATAWGECLDDDPDNAAEAFRATTAFHRILEQAARKQSAELVLIDVGPHLGAINRAALVASDNVVIPLVADLFSLQGLRNLGPTLRAWRNGWQERKQKKPSGADSLPSGEMRPSGYLVMPPSLRDNSPVLAYRRWLACIPEVYREEVLGLPDGRNVATPDPDLLALLRNYRSLSLLAQESRKPMFLLRAADGAIGGHGMAVVECYKLFESLARRIAAICHIELPEPLCRRTD